MVFFSFTELSSFMLIAIAACGADGGLAPALSLGTAAGADVEAFKVGCGGGGGGGGPGAGGGGGGGGGALADPSSSSTMIGRAEPGEGRPGETPELGREEPGESIPDSEEA